MQHTLCLGCIHSTVDAICQNALRLYFLKVAPHSNEERRRTPGQPTTTAGWWPAHTCVSTVQQGTHEKNANVAGGGLVCCRAAGRLVLLKTTNPSNCTTEQYISAEKLLCDNGPQLTPAEYPCNSCRGLQGCWPSLGPGCASAGWACASACCLRTAGWPGRMFGRNAPT